MLQCVHKIFLKFSSQISTTKSAFFFKSPKNLSDVCMEFSKILLISTDSYFYKIYPKSQIFSKFSHHSIKTFTKIFIETPHNLNKIDPKFHRNILKLGPHDAWFIFVMRHAPLFAHRAYEKMCLIWVDVSFVHSSHLVR